MHFEKKMLLFMTAGPIWDLLLKYFKVKSITVILYVV